MPAGTATGDMASWTAETTDASRELHGLLDYSRTLRGSAEDVCSRADELLTTAKTLRQTSAATRTWARMTRQSQATRARRSRIIP